MHTPLEVARSFRAHLVLLLALLLATSGGLALVGAAPAAADEGPAPAPAERTVIGDVHTDAISTFWDEGELVLGTKADTPELHTRYDADAVWFHVDQDSRMEDFPAGFEFVAPQGSTVWLAPEVQQSGQIWPGFSTESVPTGTLDNNDTTLRLVSAEGPGDVELWQTGTFGAAQRLWSSDEEAYKSFTRKNVHMHANWAFTEVGTYHLTVEATAAVDGAPVSDTAVYTFIVGDLPEDVATTTTLAASSAEIVTGDPVTLSATVAPEGVEGYVEFRDGEAVLGHDAVADGSATLEVSDLAVGDHAVTAVFVPALANTAEGSTSQPVTISVTDGSGVEFGIAGIEDVYQPGDTVAARVVGHTLAEGESYRWVYRVVGGTTTYAVSNPGEEAAAGRHSFDVDPTNNGYEYAAQLRSGSSTLAQTPFVTVNVANAVEPINGVFQSEPAYLGDDAVITLQGRELAEGESLRAALRWGGPWYVANGNYGEFEHVGDTMVLRQTGSRVGAQWAIQVVRDGQVLAQSDPITGDISAREVLVEGVQGVYRVGQTLRATAEVAPPKEGMIHQWFRLADDGSILVLEEGTEPENRTLELPMTLDLHDKILYYRAKLTSGSTTINTGSWSTRLKVSDTDPGTQLLFFENLSGHYHQGSPVHLNLVADPELADGDTIAWEWKWPDTEEWAELPDASGMSHTLTAEQALDGVEVRAVLTFADSGETLTAEPVTIHVDDHGATPRQQPSINGETNYTEGNTVTLTRVLPENGPTILTEHRWEKRTPGAQEWTAIAGQAGSELSLPADVADDGAQIRVSILKPGGALAYGPSDPVTLSVEEGTDPTPEPTVPVATKVTAGTVKQIYGRTTKLTVNVAPKATGKVSVRVGSRTLAGNLSAGRATVTVPAKLLAPGKRSVAITYAGVTGKFKPSSGRATVDVVRAAPKVTVTGKKKVKRGRVHTVDVAVGATGVRPTGWVKVAVAGKTKIVKLRGGRASVRVAIPRRTKAGVKVVRVTYLGDKYVTRSGTKTARVRVVR